MNKKDYLQLILKDVFNTQKISIGSTSKKKSLNRYNHYFKEYPFKDNYRIKFEMLFQIALCVENSYFECNNHTTKPINKADIAKKLSAHIQKYYCIDIDSKFWGEEEEIKAGNEKFRNYVNDLVNFVETVISPALFNNEDSNEIDLNDIKKKLHSKETSSDLIIEKSVYDNSVESIMYLLSEEEKVQLNQNIDSCNKRIIEAENDDMGMMTLSEYIRRLERESIKFYRNVPDEKLYECLETAKKAKELFESDNRETLYFAKDLSSRIELYILKLERIIMRQC